PADLGRPYLFTVATLEPRKNVGTLVEAHALLGGSHALAVAGGAGWGAQPALDREGVVRLGFVRHEELPRWYRGADVFVFPARYVKALLRELPEVRRLSFGGAGRASTLLRDALWYPFLIPTGGLDVLHCPTYRGPVRSRTPVVVTVHDLAVFRHPEAFNRWTRTYSPVVVPRVLTTAARVIAVSEFTRGELVELLDVPVEKIRVVPNGVEDAFAPEGPAAEGDYVLAVGTLEPRKNLPRLAEAARRADVELRVG